jgi:hypothetical protein
VGFELAMSAFKDVFAIEYVDDRADYGELRLIIIGMAEGRNLLSIVFTEREETIRIISARRASQREQDEYFKQNS